MRPFQFIQRLSYHDNLLRIADQHWSLLRRWEVGKYGGMDSPFGGREACLEVSSFLLPFSMVEHMHLPLLSTCPWIESLISPRPSLPASNVPKDSQNHREARWTTPWPKHLQCWCCWWWWLASLSSTNTSIFDPIRSVGHQFQSKTLFVQSVTVPCKYQY